jgi:hypothetical protein
MDLDTFIIAVFCWIDEALPHVTSGQRVRQRGPEPVLYDSEVLTMEVVGTYLGLNQDSALFAYFRRHYAHFFPRLHHVHRTTFVRQAANLWWVKERLWQHLLAVVPHDPQCAILDSLPLHVCQFARAPRCRRFRGEAAYGKDHVIKQTYYGFRLHARVCWPGVLTRLCLAPANLADPDVAPTLTEDTQGVVVGDRLFWRPRLQAELRQDGVLLLAPFLKASRDPWPARSRVLSRVRYRIDTIFGQLTDRCALKRVWARDTWHLTNRLLRAILMHTLAVLFNIVRGNPPLHLARLVAS